MQRQQTLMIEKDGELDRKHTRQFNSEEELDAAYQSALKKYNAVEDPFRESNYGPLVTYGLFKYASGKCEHGKKVNVSYLDIRGRDHSRF